MTNDGAVAVVSTKILAMLLFVAGITFVPMSAHSSPVGKTYEGTVTLVNIDGDPVPYHWCIRFNIDGTVDMTAEGIYYAGTYEEKRLGAFYSVALLNEFDSEFTGVSVSEDQLNVILRFSDNEGNSVKPSALFLSSCVPE